MLAKEQNYSENVNIVNVMYEIVRNKVLLPKNIINMQVHVCHRMNSSTNCSGVSSLEE